MKKACISKNWLLKTEFSDGYTEVDLPNDYSITLPRSKDAQGKGSNGYFQNGLGKYVKFLSLESTPHHCILDIDGAYMCTSVVFNERQLAMHPHGYTPFLVDLTKHARFGQKNKLVISTNALQQSTCWYSGAGIYRDVFLWEGGDIRIEPWDVFVTTPTFNDVAVFCKVTSDVDADVILRSEISDADGNVVAACETSLALKENVKTDSQLNMHVENPQLWDVENPYLYTLNTAIIRNGKTLDTAGTKFGIRTICADAENGFLLNGKPLKLRGGCIHHDHGVLGAADFATACYRKLTKLKDAGFNALRSAHNPPSLQMLEMCDKLGILVMDEAFDTWCENKGGNVNYHLWFADWWKRDISYMVQRDRNHPCVISYSIGNEIPESCGKTNGAELSELLSAEIRKYDSTRLVTSATWELPAKYEDIDPEDYDTLLKDTDWGKRTEKYYAPLDICGYNYMYTRYESDHKLFPKRVIWGSETHVLNFFKSWNKVLENNHVIGDFTWTAYDNLGEAGTGRFSWARDGVIDGISVAPYPWRSCYQGDLDLCGYRRPQSYFRQAVWLGNAEPKIFTTHPKHYGEGFTGTGWHWHDVLDSWTYDDEYIGKPVSVRLRNEAELQKQADCDLYYIDIDVIDESKNRVPYAQNKLCARVENGRLLGIFSGDPANEDCYGSDTCHAFEGCAVAVVKADRNMTATLAVGGDGLCKKSIELKMQSSKEW